MTIINQIDQKIRRAFSDAAMQYDVLTGLQKEIGRELFKKTLHGKEYANILDVGMGTGWLTSKFKFYYPESQIVGLDFADGMIQSAKCRQEDFSTVQADAAVLPFKDETFDLVISNLAYQWVLDLPNAFRDCHRVITDDGKMYFTLFGYHTFQELFASIEHCADEEENKKISSFRRLANFDQVQEALRQAGFKDLICDYEKIKVRFPDVVSLIKWIKDIGANCLGNNFYFGKKGLCAMDSYFQEHFSDRLGIYTTFEVIWVEGKK